MNIEKAKSRIDSQLLKSMYSDASVDGFHPMRVIQALKSIIGINIEKPSKKLIDWGDNYLSNVKSLPEDYFKYPIEKAKETIVLSSIGDCIISGDRDDCMSELQDLCLVSDGNQIFEYLIEFSCVQDSEYKFMSCLPFIWSAHRSNLFLKNKYSYQFLLLSIDSLLNNRLYYEVIDKKRLLYRDIEYQCVLHSIASSPMTREDKIYSYLQSSEYWEMSIDIENPQNIIDIEVKGRVAILNYLENLDSRDITAELLLALAGFRMILKSDPSPKVQVDMHKILNYIIGNNGWINDRQNW